MINISHLILEKLFIDLKNFEIKLIFDKITVANVITYAVSFIYMSLKHINNNYLSMNSIS